MHIMDCSPVNGDSTCLKAKPFTVNCRVHDRETFTEPCLIELLNSKAMKRLAHISQHGISTLVGITPEPTIDRLEHSIGAAILVRRAGGSLEAQAAALLHDVAHTALSHVIDGVWGRVVHETDKMKYLESTDIPDILKKHFSSPNQILDEANFSLLELNAPKLCADRLDYGLRDILLFGVLKKNQIDFILSNITVHGGEFVVKSVDAARLFADAYMDCDQVAWSNYKHAVLYKFAADAIRIAHQTGVLTDFDLWRTDIDFWSLLKSSTDPQIKAAIKLVRGDLIVERISEEDAAQQNNLQNYTVTLKMKMKIRTVDPSVLLLPATDSSKTTQVSCAPLSQLDDEYRKRREAYISSKMGELNIGVVIPT